MSLNVHITMLDNCADHVTLDGFDHNDSGMDAFHCGLSVMERLVIRAPNLDLPTSLDLFVAYHADRSLHALWRDVLVAGGDDMDEAVDARWWMDDELTEDEALQAERYLDADTEAWEHEMATLENDASEDEDSPYQDIFGVSGYSEWVSKYAM